MAIIHHGLRIIFIHNQRCAGTSMSSVLVNSGGEKISTKHCAIGRVKYLVLDNLITPETFDDYFKFAFVRNPWDRALSLYRYRLNKRRWHALKGAKGGENPTRNLSRLERGFEYYMDMIKDGEIKMPKSQAEMTFIEGEQSMDFIGRYESLHSDWVKAVWMTVEKKLDYLAEDQGLDKLFVIQNIEKLLNSITFDEDCRKNAKIKIYGIITGDKSSIRKAEKILKLPKRNIMKLKFKGVDKEELIKKNYRDLYTERSRGIVEELYHDDIDEFNYSF